MGQKYEEKTKPANKKKKKFKRYVKYGICDKTGKQRWYDKKEKKHFYKTYADRGHGDEMKKQAISLVSEGNGYRAVGRLLNISHTCVYYWVRDFCKTLNKQELPKNCSAIEFDEMWHFCQKKSTNLGVDSSQ